MFLLLLLACGVDQDNFSDRFAEVSCERGLECELVGYEQYEDVRECRPEATTDWNVVVELGEEFGCGLDYDYARGCLKVFKKAECDAIVDRSWETEGDCAELFACLE